ncbi:MAG: helix-turn-helix transcriptional regulator [Oscillospiraceae bacterium]|nr:helix-turn-helix transcriptional regulator [Oscillospiraceae bacterium]
MEKKSIGSFMAVLRKAQGLTQQDVADRLNVSNKTVSKWERDESSPELGLIPVIAEIFDVTCDEILLGKRLIKENDETNTSQKVEKQITRLAENTARYFRNMALIVVLISIFGYLALFLCSYAFDLLIPGAGLYTVFLLIGTAVLITSLNNSLHRLNTGSDTDEKCVLEARADIWQICFFAFLALLLTFFFSLPLIIARDLYILSEPPYFRYELHVLSWEIYLNYIPTMILMWLFSAISVLLLLRRKLQGSRSQIFTSVENGFKLGIIQTVFFAIAALPIIITEHTDISHNFFYINEMIALISFGLSAITAVIYIVLKRGNYLLLSIMAIRNQLLWIPALLLTVSINLTASYGFIYPISWISSAGRHQGDNFRFNYMVQHFTYDIGVGIVIFTAIVLSAYIAVKYKYMNNHIRKHTKKQM